MAKPAGVVLRRELIRLARRRQTWINRGVYAALLLGFCLLILADLLRRADDPSAFGRIGRDLFYYYSGLQMFAVALIAPIQVASGITEEKDARTLDLMTLTGLSARAILADQIASRLFVLATVVFAGLPFVALLNNFGGFAPIQVVNGAYSALALAAILGNFAAFASLVTRGGPLVPWVLCIPYAMVIFVVPTLTASVWMGEDVLIYVNPLAGAIIPEAGVPASALLWGSAIAIGWGLMVPVFEIQAGGDEGDEPFGLLSPDIWAVERFKRNTWLWGIAMFAFWGFQYFAYEVLGFRSRDLAWLGWLGAWLCWVALHRIALVVVMDGSERIQQLMSAPIRLPSLRGTQLERPPRAVWSLPITWRELATRASGPARLLPIAIGLLWLGLVGLFWLVGEFRSVVAYQLLAGLAALGGWLCATLVATSTLLDERRRRTFGLLLLTRLDPQQIARQKTWALVAYASPLSALGTLLWMAVPRRPHSHELMEVAHQYGGANVLPGVPFVDDLAWLVWMLLIAGNVGLIAAIVAAWVAERRAAWAVSLTAVSLWVFGPLVFLVALEELGWRSLARQLEVVVLYWYPFIDEGAVLCWLEGIPTLLLGAIALQAVATPFFWRILAWRIRVLGLGDSR